MTATRIGAALSAVLSLGAPSAAATAADSAVEQGRAIAASRCAGCHAIGAAGESPVALAPAFRTLQQRYPVDHLAEALAEGTVTGHPMMPELRFDPPEIEALLSYLESLPPPPRRR